MRPNVECRPSGATERTRIIPGCAWRGRSCPAHTGEQSVAGCGDLGANEIPATASASATLNATATMRQSPRQLHWRRGGERPRRASGHRRLISPGRVFPRQRSRPTPQRRRFHRRLPAQETPCSARCSPPMHASSTAPRAAQSQPRVFGRHSIDPSGIRRSVGAARAAAHPGDLRRGGLPTTQKTGATACASTRQPTFLQNTSACCGRKLQQLADAVAIALSRTNGGQLRPFRSLTPIGAEQF